MEVDHGGFKLRYSHQSHGDLTAASTCNVRSLEFAKTVLEPTPPCTLNQHRFCTYDAYGRGHLLLQERQHTALMALGGAVEEQGPAQSKDDIPWHTSVRAETADKDLNAMPSAAHVAAWASRDMRTRRT